MIDENQTKLHEFKELKEYVENLKELEQQLHFANKKEKEEDVVV